MPSLIMSAGTVHEPAGSAGLTLRAHANRLPSFHAAPVQAVTMQMYTNTESTGGKEKKKQASGDFLSSSIWQNPTDRPGVGAESPCRLISGAPLQICHLNLMNYGVQSHRVHLRSASVSVTVPRTARLDYLLNDLMGGWAGGRGRKLEPCISSHYEDLLPRMMLIEQPVSSYQQPGPLQVSRWDFCLSDFISSVLCEMSATVKRCGEKRVPTVRFNAAFNGENQNLNQGCTSLGSDTQVGSVSEEQQRGGWNDFKRLL